ncbi:hydrogenase maturation protease [Nocardioides sp. MAHUQ-72]|uniref:hydrogenase maturation protease n=1 Tax=unclassified Nocardioides TaxID=2615069 RepID=UPI003613031C
MSPLVVGIGNASCGDDGVGPLVADRVAGLRLAGVEVVVHDEPLALVELLGGHEDVVVVDAARSPGGEPGELHVVRVGSAPVAGRSRVSSSHGLGVVDAVELARALGRLPERLTLVGVEAGAVDVGSPMSPQVRDRVDDAVRAVVAALPTTTR